MTWWYGLFIERCISVTIAPMISNLLLIGGAAILDSVNPCAFSILFLTIGFLFALGRDRKFVLKTGLLYIFGIFIVYLLIGLGVLQVFSFFNVPNGLAKIGALAIMVFGIIQIINEFSPNFPIKLKIPQSAHLILAKKIQRATLGGALIIGILVGLFEFPCTGGPYLFVLGLLHDRATVIQGFFYLVYYNILFVAPLVLILLASSNKAAAERIDRIRRQETRKSRLGLALAMIALGIIIFFI